MGETVRLHKYDLRLCDYVRGNVLPIDSSPRYVAALQDQLPPPLFQYLAEHENEDDHARNMLLSREELWELQTVLDDQSYRFKPEWLAYEALHRDYVATLPEIRERLAKRTADRWAEDCHRYAVSLEAPRLSVPDGIQHVSEWLNELRRLIAAMDRRDLLPAPDGGFATPTCPNPSDVQSGQTEDEHWDRDVAKVRSTLEKIGNDKKPQVVRQHAGMNNQRCREILRHLAEQNEYAGFTRRLPPRSEPSAKG